jgi:hypothetical protein
MPTGEWNPEIPSCSLPKGAWYGFHEVLQPLFLSTPCEIQYGGEDYISQGQGRAKVTLPVILSKRI